MKQTIRLGVVIAMTAATLALGAATADAVLVTGTGNDGYCSFSYGVGPNSGVNDARAYSSENGSGCQLVDADLTSYYQGQTPRSKYCASSASYTNCQSGYDNVSQINGRVRGLDWEKGSWQTLYKFHG